MPFLLLHTATLMISKSAVIISSNEEEEDGSMTLLRIASASCRKVEIAQGTSFHILHTHTKDLGTFSSCTRKENKTHTSKKLKGIQKYILY